MNFAHNKNALAFFNLAMTELNHREHIEHHSMRIYDVTISGKAGKVITGLDGDIFIFNGVFKKGTTKPVGMHLQIDGAVHDNAGPEALTKRTQELLELSAFNGWLPAALLTAINEHRTCGLAPEECDPFDEAYVEEMDQLTEMLNLLV